MNYYKIIHKETDTLMCCVTCADEGADDICELLGSNEYIAVEITKEEFERETEGEQEW